MAKRTSVEVAVVGETVAMCKRLTAALLGSGIGITATAPDSGSLVQRLTDDPEALVLAVTRASRDHLAALEVLHRATRAPIVYVAPEIDWRGARMMIGQGISAIVLMDELEGALMPAITAAIAGQLVLPLRLAEHLARPVLSPREKQVIGMVVMGLRNAEIAGALYIGEATVKSHLAAAFAKLGVRSRSEATDLILDPEHGLGLGILEISGEGAASRRAPLPGVG